MEREGHRAEYLTPEEYERIVQIIERGGSLHDAVRQLAPRDRGTIARVYKVAMRLYERGRKPLSDDEAQNIADGIGYRVTKSFVHRVNLQYLSHLEKERARRRAPNRTSRQDRLLAAARDRELLTHFDDVRALIDEIRPGIYFWPVAHLSGTDPSWGMRGDGGLGHSTMYWKEGDDGQYLRLLPPKFSPVQEHVETSNDRDLFGELERWQHLGGACIQACWDFWSAVLRSSQDESGLPLRSGGGAEPVERGLFRDFAQSIYMTVFGERHNCDYHIDSEGAELDLLTFRDAHSVGGPAFTLAWIKKDERDRVVAIHRALLRSYFGAPLAQRVRQMESEMNETVVRLTTGLAEFASRTIIPGKCHLCPE